MSPIFNVSFWFSQFPQPLTPIFEKIFFIIFAAVLVAGIVVRIISNQRERDRYAELIYQKIATLLITMGALGLIWFFFTYEQIPLLGARFWFLFWMLAVVIWTALIARYTYMTVPRLRVEEHQRKEKMKYFPDRKKKKNKKRKK